MKVKNIFNVNRENYNALNEEQKRALYPEIIKCSVCSRELCTEEEYNAFIKTKYYESKRNLFSPVFFDGFLYYREVCIDCLDEKFPNNKYNVTITPGSLFSLGITDEQTIHKMKEARKVTERNLIRKYGEEEGKRRFNEYREKQAYSNSQEYKNMTDEEFKAYNLSRAVTLEKCIERHGQEKGISIFEGYKEKQAYSNTLEYNIEKYGLDEGTKRYNKIIESTKNTLPNFIKRYGEEEGLKKYDDYMQNSNRSFYSNIASELFSKIDKELNIDCIIYYAPKTKEYGKYNFEIEKYNFYDFVIPELKFCIEFNGDCFHAKPEKYKPDDKPNPFIPNLTSKEIWEADEIKNSVLESFGFEVYIVWESEYINNKSDIIDEMVKIIRRKYELFRNSQQF